MTSIIVQNIGNATLEFFQASGPSSMRLSQQAQFLAHRGGRISDLADRALQFVFCHAEMPGPVLHLVELAHADMAAVALALVKKIVTHVSVLDEKDVSVLDDKDPAWGIRRGLFAACRVRGSAEHCSFAVRLAHEQRKKQNDRKRNSD
jgi:hypothetical protein